MAAAPEYDFDPDDGHEHNWVTAEAPYDSVCTLCGVGTVDDDPNEHLDDAEDGDEA